MNATKKPDSHQNRQIVGFSLAPERAREVKAEAARRGINLRQLFEELWELYKAQPRKEPR